MTVVKFLWGLVSALLMVFVPLGGMLLFAAVWGAYFAKNSEKGGDE